MTETIPTITAARYADGWRTAALTVRGKTETVLVAPDGTRYLVARTNERADLVVDLTNSPRGNLGTLRLRLEEGSGRARAARREQRLIARGERSRKRKSIIRRKR